ncbi:MAG: DUF2239 family protein [Burkholderiaceae bacterium]|nr:DUF2239 family protein [Burkholderiaceae bacterium]
MRQSSNSSCTAFSGNAYIASGELQHVLLKVKEVLDREATEPVLVFDDNTGESIELDFRGTISKGRNKLRHASDEHSSLNQAEIQRGPGRPKLGVVGREVTLLPRHWEWLNSQPGGASVALRKLVDEARRSNETKDSIRRAQEAGYRFMSIIAGNQPGYEEAIRALFATDLERFRQQIDRWPVDLVNYLLKLTKSAFPSSPALSGNANGARK